MGTIEPLQLRFDAFELDERDARLIRDGRPIALPPRAFAVLCALARQPGQLVTKDALLDAVWGHQHVSESVLKTTISELRAALSDDAKQPRYIETASRRGYRFIGAVNAQPAPSALPAYAGDVRMQPARESTMIGRQAALTRLRGAWNDANAGRRQIFWVAGEAGVGKTTLIDTFVAELGPIACAHGQCVEHYGSGEPYLPVLEALGALCRNDATVVPMMRAVAPTWLLQLPWLSNDAERESLRRELLGTSQDRMLRELGELLERCTHQQPLLLVTEDLHWSDHATVHLIDHIARRRGPARLLWLASFRLAQVISTEHPLKALRHELRLHRLCQEVVLDPFSEREVADYIDRRLPGTEVSEAFVRVLHTHTDGLPLFVVNVLDDLISQGALQPGRAEPLADAPIVALQVPESLAGVIEKQLARLSVEQRALLEAASVCGVEFRPGTVADALERDAKWVGERCDEMAREQHWLSSLAVGRLPDGSLDARYGFRHALYRHVFYQRIGALTRAQLHRNVALSLERSRASGVAVTAAELASHYELSHDLTAALRHYADAAENALRHFAPTEAMNLTEHALSLLPRCPEGAERNELEVALLGPRGVAAARSLGVTAPETRAVFERVQVLYEMLPAATSRALELGLGWVFYIRGEYEKARTLAMRINALAESRGDRVLHVSACNLMGATVAFEGDLITGRRWLEQGLAAFAELADQLAQAQFVVDLGVSMGARMSLVLSHLGFADQARSHMDGALARAAEIRQPYAQMLGLLYAGILEVRLDRHERMQELADTLEKTVVDYAIAEGESYWRWMRGWALARMGQPEVGYALIMEGYEYHARQGRLGGGFPAVLGHAAEALILAGRWHDAQTQLDQAFALAQRIGERIHLPDLLLLQARIALGQDQIDAARGSMQAALDEARSQQALWVELSALVALCELEDAAREDRVALEDAYRRLREGFDTALVKRTQALLAPGKRSGPSKLPRAGR